MNKQLYEREFLQVLIQNDLYGGDKEYATLRSLYKDLIDAIKHTSISDNNVQLYVQLTSVDEDYVRYIVSNLLNTAEE